MQAPRADAITEHFLGDFNQTVANIFGGEVFYLDCPMYPPWDDHLRTAVEARVMRHQNDKTALPARTIVVLETGGGMIETVERMVRVLRHHFSEVHFVVPNYAYSAGTVLALSGDEIHMDYHSVLGPIDPQFTSANGEYVPGMGYLAKYQELMDKVNGAKSPDEVRGEIAYLIERFDPAKLFHIEQAIEHSKALLREWLPRYKFKNWANRETSGAVVTQAEKEARANEIAEALGDPNRWHSHGRGITCDDLDNETIKLKINNYGTITATQQAIRNYHGLLEDYMGKRGWRMAIHTRDGFGAAA